MKKIALLSTLALVTIALPAISFAATNATITINSNIPGIQDVATVGPCGWIVNFYNFALILAGILAFGAVVFGGFLYSTSAGNPSKQSEGRAWITSALLGVLLLAAAYIILYTINPNLTKCSFPGLSSIGAGVAGTTPTQPAQPGQPLPVNCASGQCQTLPNCTVSSRVNCGGAQGMVDTLNCVQQGDSNFNVSEGYPPTYAGHATAGHANGCSVDTTVPGGDCAAVQKLVAAAQACGATVFNEYANCGGKVYAQTTGGNVHINAKKGQGGC